MSELEDEGALKASASRREAWGFESLPGHVHDARPSSTPPMNPGGCSDFEPDPRSYRGVMVNRRGTVALASALTLAMTIASCGGSDGAAPTPASSSPADDRSAIALGDVPFDFLVPADLAPRLAAGPLDDAAFAAEAAAAGAAASAHITYAATDGVRITLLSAYWFPEDAFDATQAADTPPPFGVEVLRSDGWVLAVWGLLDMPFEPGSEDARAIERLFPLTYEPSSYRPTS